MSAEGVVTDVVIAPGELSFEARLGGEPRRVTVRGEEDVTPNADALLPLVLLPAMRRGGRLRIEAELSPQLLRGAADFCSLQAAWSHGWNFGEAPLREVEIEADRRTVEPRTPSGRVAAFFSGGVDSFAAVLDEPEVTDLVFVRGVDLVPHLLPDQEGLAERVEPVLAEAAAALGKRFHVVETDVRRLSDPLICWEAYCASPLSGIAHTFAGVFDRVLIATDADFVNQVTYGPARMVDQLLSSEAVEIVDHGNRLDRFARVELLAGEEAARHSLRVCWKNTGGAYNCGRCRKCLGTMLALEALGVRGEFETFPAELDVTPLLTVTLAEPVSLAVWRSYLRAMRRLGRADLEAIVAPVVERGERELGLLETADALARAEAAEERLAELTGSRSWRLTEPLRLRAAGARESVRRRRARRASASS